MDQHINLKFILIITCFSTVVSSSCRKFENHSSTCFAYINNDVYSLVPSNQIITALESIIDSVNENYCKGRVTEFLCNYFFPHCEDGYITPICEHSCNEYLNTGICVNHLFNVLTTLNTMDYLNVSLNGLLQNKCSPPYNTTVSNNCTALSGVLNAENNVLCAPLPENETCRDVALGLESYATDIAQLELSIAIVNALESARSAITALEFNIDPSCITIVDWIICTAKFPPCMDTKLILPCNNACGVILSFFTTCFSVIEGFVDDRAVREYYQRYRCRLPGAYYDGYNANHFITEGPCISIPLEMSTMMSLSNSDADESSDASTLGVIIGAIIGSCTIILAAFVIFLLVAYAKKKRKLDKNNFVTVLNHMVSKAQTTSAKFKSFTSFSIASNPIFRDFENTFSGQVINPSDLTIKEQIGEGAFGKVHKGIYAKGTETFDIAIKTLRAADASKTEQFIKECITAKHFNHPNVLSLIGVSYIKGEAVPLMILPFMHNGDVKTFLKSKRGNLLEVNEYPEGLKYIILMNICLDVAKGMEYLSSLRYVHCDLAARNCMLDDNMMAKVADFGLTRDVYVANYYRIGNNTPLPVKWLAPEALIDKMFTTQSDVWSFGVTCWEVFMLGLQPYPSIDEYDMIDYLKAKIILDKPTLSSDKMYEIMKSCWNFIPEDRPTFSLLVEQLSHQQNATQYAEPVELDLINLKRKI